MPESIWPHDIVRDPRVETPCSPHEIRCFVLLRSEPREVYDDLMDLIHEVTRALRGQLRVTSVIAERAVDIASSGVIHQEIWAGTKAAELVIADVTGYNPNVMFELGVAAASKDKRRVILLREHDNASGGNAFPFDMMPARHILYRRTSQGYSRLAKELLQCMFDALAAAPFEGRQSPEPTLPFVAELTGGKDSTYLWSPDVGHRRLLPDCLEFGSFYHFASSWISMADLKLGNLRVAAEMRFTECGPQQDPWIGVAVRSQGFYANFGYLLHMHPDGRVKLSVPNPESDPPNEVTEFGCLDQLRDNRAEFTSVSIQIDESALTFSAGVVRACVPLTDLPHIYPRGRVLFQTAFARAGLRRVRVEQL